MFHDIELVTMSQMEQVSKQIRPAKLVGVGGGQGVFTRKDKMINKSS